MLSIQKNRSKNESGEKFDLFLPLKHLENHFEESLLIENHFDTIGEWAEPTPTPTFAGFRGCRSKLPAAADFRQNSVIRQISDGGQKPPINRQKPGTLPRFAQICPDLWVL